MNSSGVPKSAFGGMTRMLKMVGQIAAQEITRQKKRRICKELVVSLKWPLLRCWKIIFFRGVLFEKLTPYSDLNSFL